MPHPTSSESGGAATLSREVTVELRKIEGDLVRLMQGEITNQEFRPKRTVMGVYGQRQPEEYMIRVRIPFGGLTATQLRRLAELAREHGDSRGHITTRQNMQLHNLSVKDVSTILWRLAEVGLTTRESGGNAVRNVTACPLAGVCSKEAFDVTPYAIAINHHFLRNPLVQGLPRKFKVALSGCNTDCGLARIQDTGAIATTVQDGTATKKGFRIFVAGGLGTFPRVGAPLDGILSEKDLLPTCEALVRIFDRLGERKDKNRARMKFLYNRLGRDAFLEEFQEARQTVAQEGTRFPPVPVYEEEPPASALAVQVRTGQGKGSQEWRQTNVVAQRQHGYSAIFILLKLGDITSVQMEALADIAERFGNGRMRTTVQQDIVLRWVPDAALPQVYDALEKAGLATPGAEGIADVTSCPGTTACSLGITSSFGVTKKLVETLQPYQQDPDFRGVRVKVSGCPNSCGQHQLGDIGLYGCALHWDGRLYPAYQLLLGGGVDEDGTHIGRAIIKIPARKAPDALVRLLAFYKSQRAGGESFRQFARRVDAMQVRKALEELTHLSPPWEEAENFIDWDQTRMYILERGEGECSV